MKIRINDLARELEIKSREILEVLPKVGVTEKKTHSSSIEEDEAERVRRYVLEQQGSGREARHRASSDELRPKIDLSKISKPGDALRAIIEQKEHPPGAARPSAVSPRPPEMGKAPATPPRVVVTKAAAPAAPPAEPPSVAPDRSAAPAAEPPSAPKPRFITPATVVPQRPVFTAPPPKVEPPKAPEAPISSPEPPREEQINTAVVAPEAPQAPPVEVEAEEQLVVEISPAPLRDNRAARRRTT